MHGRIRVFLGQGGGNLALVFIRGKKCQKSHYFGVFYKGKKGSNFPTTRPRIFLKMAKITFKRLEKSNFMVFKKIPKQILMKF